ncbi:restriction endonuclease subunit S [Enterococcus faecalis]|uniref:restriction endonuclease subunit S n=1 Tax=Enterococcus faecalis TaxID=1351 RepID=UPI0012E16895|nr:restriction endonuclease subunit S [Enterococcus faecalis]MUO22413.1 restriction endonuclease subunit S [Enterococcus faecalis]
MKYSISEICEINKFSLKKNDVRKKIRYLDTANLNQNIISKLVTYNLNVDKIPSRAKRIVRPNDILISTVRPNKLHYGLIDNPVENLIASTGFAVLSPNTKKVNPTYLYILLTLPSTTNILQKTAENSTSTYPSIKPTVISELMFDFPMLEIQKKIGDFYKSCSKKIELNNQIINTLEKTATTLFNHWFIDFEFPDKNGNPYKSSGGKLIESELGEIPEGWEVSSLKNVTEIIMGQSPKGTSYNNENIGLPLINGASDFKNGFVNPKKYTTEPKKVTKKADIIFGVRATIGNPTIVQQEYAIGRGAGIARVIDNHYQEFVFLLLEEMFKYFSNTGSGSVYINISKNDFESYKFVHPSLEVILKFHESVMSIFELIANKRSEIESLKELRNTLLPKLLSGEIELE